MSVRSDEPDPSDADLVAAYLGGEESAASELVRRHAAVLGRYLCAAGALRADVDDLVQETFFRAFRGLSGWRGDASFRSWLIRIAGNLRKDEFRRQRGRVVVSIDDHDIVDSADPEGEAGANELEERLRAAIARLPRLQRQVFLMRVHQGLEYETICAQLGTTPGAARVHYHHAVKRLKGVVG